MMTNQPCLFVGSASETEEIAKTIGQKLDDCVSVRFWGDVFDLGDFNLQALQKQAAECDFALFVWGVEDTVEQGGERSGAPRDNVVYEAGLFAGALGENRVYVVHAANTKIPSDYLGVTTATFDPASPNFDDFVKRIRRRFDELGSKPANRMSGHWWQLSLTEDDQSVVSFATIRPRDHGRTVSIKGESWTAEGRLNARWNAVATQFDDNEDILHYSWQGEHPREPGVPKFFGAGQIRYGERPVVGDFSITKRLLAPDIESSRHKSTVYLPADDDDITAMTSDDAAQRKGRIIRALTLREAYD